jgi:hypothetical protein
MNRRSLVIVACLAVAVLGAALLIAHGRTAKSSARRHQVQPAVVGGGVDQARSQLKSLRVAPAGSLAGFSAALFVVKDLDGNGCLPRQDALIGAGHQVVVKPHCRIVSGTWYDPYGSPAALHLPARVATDQVVSLREAWQSGADRWSAAERQKFASDASALQPMPAAEAAQKAGRDPAGWRPAMRAAWAQYAITWVRIKSAYGLSVDPAELRILKLMLGEQ